ncbi:MAG: cytochrome c [Azoarcus sp.]|jgi:cytochrome c55X|nr:cytochrome c [Azoarcus sp.]
MRRTVFALAGFLLPLLVTGAHAEEGASEPESTRQQALVHLVRQDCGACHGLRLTGGLGPPLTPASLEKWPPELLAATIVAGRPGTPMPPWRQFLTDTEAVWIARQLQQGFPE